MQTDRHVPPIRFTFHNFMQRPQPPQTSQGRFSHLRPKNFLAVSSPG
jgi:hypothetical protein